jgi:hypothetical protein
MLLILTDTTSYLENELRTSDEAQFHFNGDVNRRNYGYCATENLQEIRESPFGSPKVKVWCAVIRFEIMDTFESEHSERVSDCGALL